MFGRSIHIGRLFGIKIALDWTVVFIFLLVVSNLGFGLFPMWHRDWSPVLVWSLAALAGVLLFVSILLHELSHALVGRAFGMPVRSITLFIFGGVTDIEREPPSPRGELLMAAVGPATSLALGLVALLVVNWTMGDVAATASSAAEIVAAMSPWQTLLAWLGPINLLLGLFNLVPGFPLDGGRVLRATLWSITHNLERATRWASRAGQAVGWLLIVIGVLMVFGVRVPIFGTGLIGGLWLAFIGWFLQNAAVMSYRQVLVREILEDVPVERLMRRNIVPITPEMTVEELVDDYVMSGQEQTFPVVKSDRLVGIVGLDDVRKVARARWPNVRVAEVMTPRDAIHVASPEQDVYEAMNELGRYDLAQLPVLEGEQLLGMLRRNDIARWITLQTRSNANASAPRRQGSRAKKNERRPPELRP